MGCDAIDGCSVDFSDDFDQYRIIITGGPGVGKTSLIRHYENNGFHVIHEAATDVIREMLSQQIDQPWIQPGFNWRVVDLQLQRQMDAEMKKAALVFFDRSPVDVLTYCVIHQDQDHSQISQVVDVMIDQRFYHRTVFLIENLGACENNEVRVETLEEVEKIERYIEDHYRKYGFEVIRIPPAPIKERAQLILDHLKVELPGETYLRSVPHNFLDSTAVATA